MCQRVVAMAFGVLVAFGVWGASSADAQIAVDKFEVVPATTQAGAPTSVKIDIWPKDGDTNPIFPPDRVRSMVLTLPPGLVANLNAVQACSQADWEATGNGTDQCSSASRLGSVSGWIAAYTVAWDKGATLEAHGFVYRLPSLNGEPGRLGLVLRKDTYWAKAEGTATLFGDDKQLQITFNEIPYFFGGRTGLTTTDDHLQIRTLTMELNAVGVWRNPTRCDTATSRVDVASVGVGLSSSGNSMYPGTKELKPPNGLGAPGVTTAARTTSYVPSNCGASPSWRLGFDPSLHAGPAGTPQTATPQSFDAEMRVPSITTEPNGSGSDRFVVQSDVKDATVRLPAGATLSAPRAAGLGTCSLADFNQSGNEPSTCPASSRVGDVTFQSPLLPGSFGGRIFLGPVSGQNPGSPANPVPLLLEIGPIYPGDLGVRVKLRATMTIDQTTGQITTTLPPGSQTLPQIPFSSFKLAITGGSGPLIVTPRSCASFTSSGTLTPWSGLGRTSISSQFSVSSGRGEGCAQPSEFLPGMAVSPESGQSGSDEAFPEVTLKRRAAGFRDDDKLIGSFKTSLPPGWIGRLLNHATCTQAQAEAGNCPSGSNVGTTNFTLRTGTISFGLEGTAYLAANPAPDAVAGLLFVVDGKAGVFEFGRVVVPARVDVRAQDSGLDISGTLPTMVGGVPLPVQDLALSLDDGFMVAPQTCPDPPEELTTTFTPQGGGDPVEDSAPFALTGCEDVPFHPRLSLETVEDGGSQATGQPSAYRVGIENRDENGDPLASAVKKAEITLPAGDAAWEGLGLHAPLAKGLVPCSQDQFDNATCPEASRLGSALLDTGPDIVGGLSGGAFLGPVPTGANPGTPDNPYRLFVRLDSDDVPNITRRLEGKLTLDPDTGAVRTVFDELPPIPFESFKLTFRGGPNASLVNPLQCGELRASGVITGASDPENPRVETSQAVSIEDGRGVDCTEGPRGFEPEVTLGSGSGRAGSDEDFPTMTFTRPDGDRLLESVRVQLPPGVVGRVHGRERCADVATAVAGGCDGAGDDPDAKVGTVNILVGSGVALDDTVPLTGSLYLTDARDSSSVLGMAIVIDGQTGPFDLGKVGVGADIVMRADDHGLDIVTDAFPTIHAGIPLATRQVTMDLDDGLMVLPTRCLDQGEAITVAFTPVGGGEGHEFTAPFNITDCDQVPFDPALDFETGPLPGGSRTTGTPSSYVTAIELGEHDAALQEATIALPAGSGPWKGIGLSAPVSNGLTACSEDDFNSAAGCPESSHLATAAVSTATIGGLAGEAALGSPVPQGPDAGSPANPYRIFVRLRGEDFPAVALRVRGEITLDRISGRVTSRLTGLPPVQFTRFALTFRGGPNGSLVNPIECVTGDGLRAAGALHPASAPQSPRDVTSGPVQIDQGLGEGCPSGRRPFAPEMTLGQTELRAGSDRFPTITLRRPTGQRLLGGIRISMPPGLVGRLAGRTMCETVEAAEEGTCPDAKIGTTTYRVGEGVPEAETVEFPGEIFLVRARRKGAVVSLAVVVEGKAGPFDLGRVALGADIELRDADLGLDIVVDDLPLVDSGVPLAARVIELRMDDGFMVAPTYCGKADVGVSTTPADDGPAERATATAQLDIVDCDGLTFDPSVTWARPDGAPGDPTAPSALTTRVTLGPSPQPERPSAALRSAAIRLPQGFGLSAPSVNGLAACSPQQAASAAGCPAASRLATARIDTDTIGELRGGQPGFRRGGLFLLESRPGRPLRPLDDLPVHLRLDAVDLPSVTLRANGRISVAPDGRLVARFGQAPDAGLPPIPFNFLELAFRGGVTAPVANAPECGEHRLDAEFLAASGKARGSLAGDPERSNPLGVTGRGCEPRFRPSLLLDGRGRGKQPARRAGADDDFPRITIGRPAADTPIDRFTIDLPAGFAGRLHGRELCPSARDAVAGRCDGTSGEVGRALVDLGGARVPLDGTFPNTALHLHPDGAPQVNRVFVTRPRRADAVASLAIVVDGRTGPFDLGKTAIGADILFGDDQRLRIVGDPIPAVHGGVPLMVQRISLDLVDGFMVNPMYCPADAPLVEANFVARDGTQHTSTVDYPLNGCDRFRFDPSMTVTPDDPTAATPSGYRVAIEMPSDAGAAGRGAGARAAGDPQSALREATVVLPAGVALSAPVARGLEVCAEAAFAGAGCPEASRLGDAAVVTRTLGRLAGGVYVGPVPPGPGAGAPERPIPVYVLVRGDDFPSVALRLRGTLLVDQDTGQLTTRFTGLPPIAFSAFELRFRGGARAPMLNPIRCGTMSSDASRLVPWSNGVPAPVRTDVTIHAGRGAGCAGGDALVPTAAIEADPPLAGSTSAVTVTLGREEGSQLLRRAQVTMPHGMIGDLRGVEFCDHDDAARDACPAASRVGSITATVGAGAEPLTIGGGTVHLVGPKDGAAAGLAVSLPGTVGPFDVGRTITQIRMDVGSDGTISVDTGDLPLMRSGIPLMVRALRLRLDRQGFTLNPSSCGPLELTGRFTGVGGATATARAAFQLTGCDRLAYSPMITGKISLRDAGTEAAPAGNRPAASQASVTVAGAATRPTVAARMRAPAGGAALRVIDMTLPRPLSLDRRRATRAASITADGRRLRAGRARARGRIAQVRVTGARRLSVTLPRGARDVRITLRRGSVRRARRPAARRLVFAIGLTPVGGRRVSVQAVAPQRRGGTRRRGARAGATEPSASPRVRTAAGGGPRRGAAVSLLVEQGQGEARTARMTTLLPAALAPNPAALARECPAANLQAGTCSARSQIGTVTAYSPVLPLTLSGPVHLVDQPGPIPGLAATIGVKGILALQVTGSLSVENGRLRATLDPLPDLPLSRLEVEIDGGKDGVLTADPTEVCGTRPVLAADFASYRDASVHRRAPLPIDGCDVKAQAADAAGRPHVQVRTTGAPGGAPTVQVRVRRRSAAMPALRQVVATLPKNLKVNRRAARRGLRVTAAGRRISGRRVSLSRNGRLTINVGGSGASNVVATLGRGTVRWRRMPRRLVRGLPGPVNVALSIRDQAGRTHKLRRASGGRVPATAVKIETPKSSTPTVQLRTRTRPRSPGVDRVVVLLPRALRINPGRASRGMEVKADGRAIPARSLRLTRSGALTITLPEAGVRNVSVTMRAGAVGWRGSRRGRLTFTVRTRDINGQTQRARVTRTIGARTSDVGEAPANTGDPGVTAPDADAAPPAEGAPQPEPAPPSDDPPPAEAAPQPEPAEPATP